MLQGIILQPRDIALLEDLFVSRIMTNEHIAQLHFDGSPEAAKKRIWKLKQAELIRARERNVNEPAILHLTLKGLRILEQQAILNRYPKLSPTAFLRRVQVSKFTLEHELATLTLKSVMVPTAIPPLHCTTFSTWPRLHTFTVTHPRTRKSKAIAPDGFIQIQEGKKLHHFYLEVDRGTESLTVLLNKALAYSAHYRNGGFAESLGIPRADFSLHPFRLLIVAPSPERRDSIARHLLKFQIFTQVWLTTQKEICDNPWGSIWVRPLDYRYATTSTTIQKHFLLGDSQ